jgi:hypothetical protein
VQVDDFQFPAERHDRHKERDAIDKTGAIARDVIDHAALADQLFQAAAKRSFYFDIRSNFRTVGHFQIAS